MGGGGYFSSRVSKVNPEPLTLISWSYTVGVIPLTMDLISQWTMYSRPQIPLSGTLGWHHRAMLNSSCASSRAAGLVEGSLDCSPNGWHQWDASRWDNCLATLLTPIIISQTSLQRPEDSQTWGDQGLLQLRAANGINLNWISAQEITVEGTSADDGGRHP